MANINKVDATNIITQSFENYAAAVAQSRALIDVRDGLKPSARQILYALYKSGFTNNKPFKSTQAALGPPMEYYIHGDSSMLGILMKLSQPFYMNHRLAEVDGNYGTIDKGDNWAAARYTKIRLSKVTDALMSGINENAITSWVTAHDGEGQYPSVLPTKGYYNLVNGTMGIAVGVAASIPPMNLREVNTAIMTLLKNPEATFDELYCPPDFPTGGVVVNGDAVKEAMKTGSGSAVKIRGKMHYEPEDNKIVITEIPYGVYTESISLAIMNIIMEEVDEKTGEPKYVNPGIKNVTDFSSKSAKIYVYLENGASPEVVMNYLYKNTAIESHYTINMTMLRDGRYPQVFGWKEALEEHIIHQIKVYTNTLKCQREEALNRKHIVEGFIKLHDIIDEVIAVIKKAKGTKAAKEDIMVEFDFTESQAQAITRRTLGSLNSLDVAKLEQELLDLNIEIGRIDNLLSDEIELRKSIAVDYNNTIKQFGKDRQTEIKNVDVSNLREIFFTEDGKCYRTKPKTAIVVSTGYTNTEEYIAVSEQGIVYKMYELPARAKKVFSLDEGDKVVAVFSADEGKYLSYLSKSDNYRATSIDTLNKFKTTLTTGAIKRVHLLDEKLTKAEYKRLYK